MLKKLTALIAAITISAFALGCNTMSGVGQDIEWTGEQIQGAADTVRGQ